MSNQQPKPDSFTFAVELITIEICIHESQTTINKLRRNQAMLTNAWSVLVNRFHRVVHNWKESR